MLPTFVRRLFEFLVLCGALSELTWPSILSKRHIFRYPLLRSWLSSDSLSYFCGFLRKPSFQHREVFADFDPAIVAKFNEKKILAPGSTANSLLSELKLRAIIQNARQISKVGVL